MTPPAPPSVGFNYFPFHLHLDIAVIVVVAILLYAFGVRVLARTHAPEGAPIVTGRQMAWFATGLGLFAVVEGWPIHDIGEQSLFTFHMTEHMVLALIVPPAILKGVPGWLLRLAVRPILPALKLLTKPLPAILFFNAVLAVIHTPAVVDAMFGSDRAHFGFHALLVTSATLMWWPVLGPIPDIPKLAPPYAMGYLFVQSLVPTIPASFLTFAEDVVYKAYLGAPRLWGWEILTDQAVAGAIMKIGGGVVLWTAITVIFFKWVASEEEESKVRI